MRRHEYESRYNPAATELSRALIHDGGIHPDTLDKITRVLDGVKHTDEMISQKDTELQSKNNLLVQKDQEVRQKTFEVLNREQLLAQKEQVLQQKAFETQKAKELAAQKAFETQQTKQLLQDTAPKLIELQKTEFVDTLHKLYPDSYPAKLEKWTDKLPMKKHVDSADFQVMEKNTKIYKKWLQEKEQENIKKEFIKNLHELYPDAYPADFTEWTDRLPMKKHVDASNFKVMKKNTKIYKAQLEEKQAKELEDVKRLEEENIKKEQLLTSKDKLLVDKEQEIEFLKALLAQKELEKQELLAQKNEEVEDKSFVKNLTINSLLEELISKYTETNNLKMVNLLKQIEIQENEELLVQKDNELFIKNFLIDMQQDEVELREDEIADLKLLNQQLLHVDLGIQITGNEVSTQVNEIDLAGHHLESQSDFELI